MPFNKEYEDALTEYARINAQIERAKAARESLNEIFEELYERREVAYAKACGAKQQELLSNTKE